MKIFSLLFLMFAGITAYAQPVLVKQAIIQTTTNVIAPEEDDISEIQNGGEERMRMFRNFGDGETKTTTFIKDGMVKTDVKTEMMVGSLIRDNDKKVTTTLFQLMGKKSAFLATDEDQVEMKRKMDSMVQERLKNDTNAQKQMRTEKPKNKNIAIVYADESKKIAGYNCKKAYIVKTNFLGQKDSMAVWYNPEVKFETVHSTGGVSGMGSLMGGGANSMQEGFDMVDGFIMKYETKMGRGRTMEVTVTKLDINKEIAAKEFEVPKGYDVKPMSEMQNMFGGRGGGGRGVMIQRN